MHFFNRKCIFTILALSIISLDSIIADNGINLLQDRLAKVCVATRRLKLELKILIALLLQELVLEPGTKGYKLLENPTSTLDFDIYLFNWTNPQNFIIDDYEKPILEQIGPYRFREKPSKTNVQWHPDNSTISYQRRSSFQFVPEESAGRLDDVFTSINPVAVVSYI